MDQNLKQELRSMKIVHSALMIGVMVFLVVSVYLNQMAGSLAFDMEKDKFIFNIFLFVSNLFAIVSISVGLFVFKTRLKNIESFDLYEKLSKYREAMIVRSATIEGTAFFFIVCFLLFGANVFLIEASVGLIVLVLFYPSNYRIAQELKHDVRELD